MASSSSNQEYTRNSHMSPTERMAVAEAFGEVHQSHQTFPPAQAESYIDLYKIWNLFVDLGSRAQNSLMTLFSSRIAHLPFENDPLTPSFKNDSHSKKKTRHILVSYVLLFILLTVLYLLSPIACWVVVVLVVAEVIFLFQLHRSRGLFQNLNPSSINQYCMPVA